MSIDLAPDLDEFGWCPFALVVGEPCILCGSTRAVARMLRGDVAGAARYNWPAVVMLLAVAAHAVVTVVRIGPAGLRATYARLGTPPTNRWRANALMVAGFALWWAWDIGRW